MRLHQTISCCLFLLLALPCYADDTLNSGLKTEETTLSNGLRLVVVEHHRAPIVTHMLWFRVGAADEPPGKSGVAHYLEHMFFKGTPTVPDGEYDRRIKQMGGEMNAFTGQDFTAYYVTVAKEHLETVMALEADRMQAISPPKESFASERDVVLEERRSRIDNHPGALLGEQMTTALMRGHPYATPIIGWQQEIKILEEADVMGFYRNHYHPGNAVLLLVGDITLPEAKTLAEKQYGSWKSTSSESVERTAWPAPEVMEASEVITLRHANVQQPQWTRIYRAPGLIYGNSEQAFPLMLLADLLGEGKASRLYQKLVVEQKLVVAVNTSYNAFSLGPARWSLSAVPVPGVTLEQISQAMDREIVAIMNTPITDNEMMRIKNRSKASAIFARDGLMGLAFVFGQLYMLGLPPGLFLDWSEKTDAVTKEQLTQAAQHVLINQPFIEGHLLPEETGQ